MTEVYLPGNRNVRSNTLTGNLGITGIAKLGDGRATVNEAGLVTKAVQVVEASNGILDVGVSSVHGPATRPLRTKSANYEPLVWIGR